MDTTRKHTHSEVFPISPERLFRMLHTPSAIRGWWGAARVIVEPAVDGLWVAAWGDDEDDPDYVTIARMSVFDPPHRITFTDYRYLARTGGLPFEAEFTTEFRVTPHEDGSTLRVVQDGFPLASEADDFYAACEAGWRNTFAGIRAFIASTPAR